MKKLLIGVVLMAALSMVLVGCDAEKYMDMLDYKNAEDFEKDLNDGSDLSGKYVMVEVYDVAPASFWGYNVQAGEHLNFVSPKNIKAEKGDLIVFEVDEVNSVLGSFIITYKDHKIIEQ